MAKDNSPEALVGKTIDGGRYLIERFIGEGGMGRVYAARQVSMKRTVAIKMLRAHAHNRNSIEARFKREAMSISRLTHPNIITIFDYGMEPDGQLFMVMEYLTGKSAKEVLGAAGRLKVPRVLSLISQVAEAVVNAHENGVVHRDLKPENIVLEQVTAEAEYAKVLDFGIAKIVEWGDIEASGKFLTPRGLVFGTPAYMSPEQVMGSEIDPRTDIYALGIIMFEMLAGAAPFERGNLVDIMEAHTRKPLPKIQDINPHAEVPVPVEALIEACTRKKPADRIQTMQEVVNRLRSLSETHGDGAEHWKPRPAAKKQELGIADTVNEMEAVNVFASLQSGNTGSLGSATPTGSIHSSLDVSDEPKTMLLASAGIAEGLPSSHQTGHPSRGSSPRSNQRRVSDDEDATNAYVVGDSLHGNTPNNLASKVDVSELSVEERLQRSKAAERSDDIADRQRRAKLKPIKEVGSHHPGNRVGEDEEEAQKVKRYDEKHFEAELRSRTRQRGGMKRVLIWLWVLGLALITVLVVARAPKDGESGTKSAPAKSVDDKAPKKD